MKGYQDILIYHNLKQWENIDKKFFLAPINEAFVVVDLPQSQFTYVIDIALKYLKKMFDCQVQTL